MIKNKDKYISLPQKIYLFPFLIFVVTFSICLFIYTQWRERLQSKLEKDLLVAATLSSKDFEILIKNNLKVLQDFSERIAFTQGKMLDYWEQDASNIKNDNESLQFVEYIDENGIISKVYPNIYENEILGCDLKNLGNVYEHWLGRIADGKPHIAYWEPSEEHNNAFLIDVPVFINSKFKGTITAGMVLKDKFDRYGDYLNKYAIQLKDERGKYIYSYNNPKPSLFPKKLIINIPIIYGSNTSNIWAFQFMYKNQDVIKGFYKDAFYRMLWAFLLSIFLGFIVFFNLKNRYLATRYSQANHMLQKVNEELEIQTNLAKHASQSKTEFLSNMSHEIRTPLNAIVGLTSLMENKTLSDELKENVSLMQLSSETLLMLVNNLLSLDQIESGNLKLSTDVFYPKQLVENQIAIYRKEIVSKGLQFEDNIIVDVPKMVTGDKGKFEQIINNILKNATKYTQKGKITVTYGEQEIADRLVLDLKIKDTGVGIAKKNQNIIFDRFSQVDASISKKQGGSGLGLAITKKFLELMGGKIYVKSTLGQGSIFTITLDFPLIKENTYRDSRLPSTSLWNKQLDVLVVDDNRLNLSIIVRLLGGLNINVDSSLDGNKALNMVMIKRYDVIFMDVHMPDIDGFEATKRIRELDIESIIIGLSADATETSIKKGIESGMNAYVIKPVNKEYLIKILNTYFG